MSKRIVYEKMCGCEKAYRVTMIVTYVLAAVTVLSCIFTVPDMDEDKSAPLLCVYSVVYVVYLLLILACSGLAFGYFRKTRREYAAVQSVMLVVAAAFTAANVKMFFAFFLYGIGGETKVEELFGSDMRALTDSFTAGWMMLVVGFAVVMLLGVLSIVRLASKKYS